MNRTIVAAAVAAFIAGPAMAQAPAAPASDQSPLMQEIVACRAIADADKRLACLDAAAAKMDEAQKSGQVVVMDREQVKERRKHSFGLHMPDLNPFRGEHEDKVGRVTTAIASWEKSKRGRWRFLMEDGAVWDQVDIGQDLLRPPHRGSKAEIRQAMFGSYFIRVDGQRALRVHRVL